MPISMQSDDAWTYVPRCAFIGRLIGRINSQMSQAGEGFQAAEGGHVSGKKLYWDWSWALL